MSGQRLEGRATAARAAVQFIPDLQVTSALGAPSLAGGAYLGIDPDQNFVCRAAKPSIVVASLASALEPSGGRHC
jgi:hypothetical protein